MSFFHEPPPLDCDIPPPLDDKLRENDFDLEDEEVVEDRQLELPELPTDFNVFSSVATDEGLSYSHPPPELPSFAYESSPPPDDHQIETIESSKSESFEKCDVAKEKESDTKINEVVSQQFEDREEGSDEKLDELSTGFPLNEETIIEKVLIVSDDVNGAKHLDSAAVLNDDDDENIPSQKNVEEAIDVNLHSKELDNKHEIVLESSVSDEAFESPEDDEFDDFVEAVPSEVKLESFDAFKTEELHGTEPSVEVFNKIAIKDDIPKQIPELTLDDDDDDDFNDFETAIPVNRLVMEQVRTLSSEAEEVQFEADFSGFNAFSEQVEENTFDEFKNFKAAGFDSDIKEQENQDEDDDDDFGDFNDFTQGPDPIAIQQAQPEVQSVALMKPADVTGTLDMMFPPTTSCSNEKPEALDADNTKEQQAIKSDTFVNKFNDFDSTLALVYQYNSSNASRTLVKALGIDTRNILLGPQWNSSTSSNMPRFAANLSFSPIEPMKPSSTQTPFTKSLADPKPSILQPTKVPSDLVPEAEFDWNSSGLVNPLDGPQPKPKQSHDPEPVVVQQPAAPSTHPFENESSIHVVDQEVTQVFEGETKANAGNKPELSEPSAYQWSNDVGSQHHVGHFSSSANSSILVRERTIKLPETHIFTPVKGTSPVAREVVSRDASPAPDDQYFPKGPITVKEYHDVEYSLEPKKRIDSDVDFDDFQSAQPVVVKSNPPLVAINLLEPQKVTNISTEIKWPEPGNVVPSIANELDFLETPTVEPPKVSFNLPLPPQATLTIAKKKDIGFTKPVIGTSPTEHNGSVEEDDFNDFQAAPTPNVAPLQVITQVPPPPQPTKIMPSNDPITLSPARLVATANKPSNQKSTWISSFDNDEISRIEAAFPKCKTEKKALNDDDDWSDFVGAGQPSSLPFSHSQPPSMISSHTMPKLSNGDADDWSDFVSVPAPIAKIPSAKSSGAISSQFQSKPNFSSWNQPMSKPYVNHTTSFLSNDSGSQSQQFTSNNYPFVAEKLQRNAMNITNNFSYGFNHTELFHGTGTPGNHHQQPKSNGISTILPVLDFAMPKNMINLPRGGQLDPGKK